MRKKREYTVVVHRADEGGFWAEIPSLPGCFTQAETLKEIFSCAQEAIESHLIALRADGQKIPIEDVVVVKKVSSAA